MVVFDDIMEQNYKVALSIVAGSDFEVQYNDYDELCVVVPVKYLYDNFGELFVDNFFYNPGSMVDYDDIGIEVIEHVGEVIDNLTEYNDTLYNLLRKINNHVDYVSEFDGYDLSIGYFVDMSSGDEEILAEKLQDVEFGS